MEMIGALALFGILAFVLCVPKASATPRAAIGIITVMLVVAGCVTTKTTLVDPTAVPYPAVSPDSVRIFTSETELDSLEYVRIAVIEGQSKGMSQSSMSALRKKAGELGANAILLLQSEMVPGVRMTTVVALRVVGRKSRQ